MCTKECESCHEVFEYEDLVEIEEFSDIYYCTDCAKDLSYTCPHCGNSGCNHCLMLEY